MGSLSDAGRFGAFSPRDNTHSAVLNHLHALPYRMAETFGKPKSAQDVFATLSAIAAFIECCGISFASDEVGVAWRGLATWLTKVPDHFNHLSSRHSPDALLVLAYWAALLVKRAQNCGCWFLRGSSKTILLQIAERLPVDGGAVQTGVGSLMA